MKLNPTISLPCKPTIQLVSIVSSAVPTILLMTPIWSFLVTIVQSTTENNNDNRIHQKSVKSNTNLDQISKPPSLSFLIFATANQFTGFDNAFNKEVCAAFGATINIVASDTVFEIETKTPNGVRVISTTKDIMQAKSKGNLLLPSLPPNSKIAHKMNVSQN